VLGGRLTGAGAACRLDESVGRCWNSRGCGVQDPYRMEATLRMPDGSTAVAMRAVSAAVGLLVGKRANANRQSRNRYHDTADQTVVSPGRARCQYLVARQLRALPGENIGAKQCVVAVSCSDPPAAERAAGVVLATFQALRTVCHADC